MNLSHRCITSPRTVPCRRSAGLDEITYGKPPIHRLSYLDAAEPKLPLVPIPPFSEIDLILSEIKVNCHSSPEHRAGTRRPGATMMGPPHVCMATTTVANSYRYNMLKHQDSRQERNKQRNIYVCVRFRSPGAATLKTCSKIARWGHATQRRAQTRQPPGLKRHLTSWPFSALDWSQHQRVQRVRPCLAVLSENACWH